MSDKTTNKPEVGVDVDTYDRGIVPAETAARKEREGDAYKSHPHQEGDESLDTSAGYTVDKEGLVNNYAIEPEMYVNEPGDLREKEESLAAERAEELREAREDKDGDLTIESDQRGRGQGLI